MQIGNTIVQFYNLSGQLIYQQQVNAEVKIQKMQLPNLAASIYEVVIFDQQSQKKLAGKLVVL